MGGLTNWVDFSSSPLVALFFACFGEEGEESEDGRIIIAKESYSCFERVERIQNEYVNSLQSSVLVHPKRGGVIDIVDGSQKIKVVLVSKEDKKHILADLRRRYGISIQLLYHGIHGYVRIQKGRLLNVEYEEVEKVEDGVLGVLGVLGISYVQPLPYLPGDPYSSNYIRMRVEKDS